MPENEPTPAQRSSLPSDCQQVLTEVERLTPEEQAQIEAFSDKIDLHKSEIVVNYGATVQKQSAAIATKTLQDVKTKNTGEISGLLRRDGVRHGRHGGRQDQGGFLSGFLKRSRKTP